MSTAPNSLIEFAASLHSGEEASFWGRDGIPCKLQSWTSQSTTNPTKTRAPPNSDSPNWIVPPYWVTNWLHR